MEALKRFGEGTKSAKRIGKALLKFVQICMTLIQCNPEHDPAILSALALHQQSDAAKLGGVGSPLHQGTTTGDALPSGMVPTFPQDDPFAAFDMGMQQYWTDNSLDLFTDLVGVEPGLTAMMAG